MSKVYKVWVVELIRVVEVVRVVEVIMVVEVITVVELVSRGVEVHRQINPISTSHYV